MLPLGVAAALRVPLPLNFNLATTTRKRGSSVGHRRRMLKLKCFETRTIRPRKCSMKNTRERDFFAASITPLADTYLVMSSPRYRVETGMFRLTNAAVKCSLTATECCARFHELVREPRRSLDVLRHG